MARIFDEWQFYDANHFHTFARSVPATDDTRGMDVLMALNDDGSPTGDFRVCISGWEQFAAHLPLVNILPDLPQEEANTYIFIGASAADVSPPINSTATPWRDLEDMLNSKAVLFTNLQGELVENNTLLPFLAASGDNVTLRGAAIRWAVAVSPSGQIQLQLQGLPSPAKFLNSAQFNGDNSVSVLLGTYDLQTDMSVTQMFRGPVPLLFAANQELARDGVIADPANVFRGVHEINNRFLLMEHLTLGEAVKYLQSKKPRQANGVSVFASQPEPTKRPRPTAGGAETGRNFSLSYNYLGICPYPTYTQPHVPSEPPRTFTLPRSMSHGYLLTNTN